MATFTSLRVAFRATTAGAVALAALTLAACSSGGPSDGAAAELCAAMRDYTVPTGAQSVAVVLDSSKSMRGESWADDDFDHIVTDAAGVYGTLSVLWVGGTGETPVWAIDNLPLNSEGYRFGTLLFGEAVDAAPGCVKHLIGAPATAEPGTDLGTAIQVAADRLAGAKGPKKLVVISDGLSNTGPIDLTGAIAVTAVDASVARLDTTGYRPDLSHTEVTFVGLGVTAGSILNGPTVTWLRNYYADVCKRAGSTSCDTAVSDQGATARGTSPRANAPDDPDLALPAVQFELSDAEVRFATGSTKITAEADAALTKVAACLQDGSKLTVIGHADNTGDPASNLMLSTGRAKAVAGRVVQLAGNPKVTVVAFGVGDREPKTSTGDQSEDRRVVISLTGRCK